MSPTPRFARRYRRDKTNATFRERNRHARERFWSHIVFQPGKYLLGFCRLIITQINLSYFYTSHKQTIVLSNVSKRTSCSMLCRGGLTNVPTCSAEQGPHTCKKVFFSIICYYVYIVKMTRTTQNKLVEFETTHFNIHNFSTCGALLEFQSINR